MKKIIPAIIVAIMLLPALANADTNYDYIYNGKTYTIYYPEHIEFLEYQFLTGNLSESDKWYKLVYLNVALTKHGYNPIW